MKNKSHHQGKLQIIIRLPSSTNGNPRYLLRIDGLTCRTSIDSSLAYALPNFNGKRVNAVIGTHYGVPTLASVKEMI